ncbi:hypothetical protein HMI54_006996 [Coelomomyces lativittatus]|nr:hypothetical protein HMI56_005666 [Coelomomyces lativittatus]KAJ1504450.1 hypothetical protein HMI54_006996 [Coelomomyces lativittatus]
MALNYLSKQLELLPSNPASYQVRVELYQLYESQFQGLLARAIELQLIPPTLIENTIWIEKPSDMLGALFFDVQEQLKKEGKLLTYERHIHMIIGLALVIFMTWAFFYLPILNLDADDL